MFDWCYCIGRLLYFMLVKYRMCGQCLPANAMSLDFIIHTLCAMIWHERNLIIEMNIPNATKDLFLEQSKVFHWKTQFHHELWLTEKQITQFMFQFFSSTSMWSKWIYNFHWREYCYKNGTMASFRVWLLWIFWWYPSDW